MCVVSFFLSFPLALTVLSSFQIAGLLGWPSAGVDILSADLMKTIQQLYLLFHK